MAGRSVAAASAPVTEAAEALTGNAPAQAAPPGGETDTGVLPGGETTPAAPDRTASAPTAGARPVAGHVPGSPVPTAPRPFPPPIPAPSPPRAARRERHLPRLIPTLHG